MFIISFLVIANTLFSCGGSSTNNNPTVEPGIILAEDTMKILEDQLNETYFTVKLETTEQSDSGIYQVSAAWGYNEGAAKIKLPNGLETAKPAIRADSGYTYIIGFKINNDTSFHDYFRIAAENGNIKMRYIKAYYY